MASFTTALIFCLVAFAYAASVRDEFDSSVITSEKCAKGPAVWCKNFTEAADCNALTHCLQTVWLTEKVVDDDGSCQSCTAQINQIRKNVNANTTKELLENALDYVCELSILGRIFRKTCENAINEYVDKYLNDLLDLLSSGIDSQSICRLLGFCDMIKEAAHAFVTPVEKNDEEAVVHFQNIVLHLPARYLSVSGLPKTNQLVGSKKCTWGPSYWCSNIQSSKECKSTSHCAKTVWSRQQYNDDNDDVCKICKDMVKQARDQLQSNETQQELREVFEGSCKLIPIKEVRNECIKLADEFVPELTEMLVSEMNPTAICTVAGLCNSEHVDLLLAQRTAVSAVYDDCTNCTAAVTAVERYLHNNPREVIAGKLLGLCGQLSTYSDSCSVFVLSKFEDIYSLLMKEVKPAPVCHLNGMCQSRYHLHDEDNDVTLEANVTALLATPNDDLPCDLCVQLVKHFRDILVANTTEEEFLQVLKGICQQTGKFKDDCLEIVNNNFKIIFKFLTEELDPPQFCREIDLCPRKNFVSDENLNLITAPLLPSAVSALPPSSKPKVGNSECRFCKLIIKFIQHELKKPEYKDNIEKAIKEVCHLVPRGDKAKCEAFIRDHEQELIKLVTEEADPGVVCSLLDLCTEMQYPIANYEFCPICQYVAHFLQEELENPTEQRDIKRIVLEICQVVPAKEAEECKKFINEYAELIIVVLSQELDPSTVCPVLKLCPSSQSPVTRCDHCLHLMQNLIDGLTGDRSEDQIQNKLQHFVPSKRNDMTAVALELNITHHENIIDMMMAGFDAPESCVYLSFCDPKKIAPSDQHALSSDEANDSFDSNEIAEELMLVTGKKVAKTSCELCQLMVRLYEDKFTSNASVKELEDVLMKYCENIEDPELSSNCTHFVLTFVPALVELLKKDVKPKDVCGLAKLCDLQPLNTFSIETTERCRLCEAVIGSLQAMAADPYVVNDAVREVEKMCKFFGEKRRDSCAQIVTAIGPQIDSIILGLPSWFYCSKIDMCPYAGHLIDRKVCETESLWCQDKKTAILCDKLKHCQKGVWKSDSPSRK